MMNLKPPSLFFFDKEIVQMSSALADIPAVDASALSLENMKSSLYCVRCNKILRDAVEVNCCHALYCSACVHPDGIPYDPSRVDGVVECNNCGRVITECPKPNLPVRRLVGTIPVPCPMEGCAEIVAAGALQDHVQKQCEFRKVGCKYFARGCAATMLYKDSSEHEHQYCIFRDVACPQGCGLVQQWRECSDHFLFMCPKTLVDCTVKCGALVERCQLFHHMNECPLKPLPCPYRNIGCTLKEILRRPELEDHMNLSVHAHMLLVDAKLRDLQAQMHVSSITQRRPSSHDWDPGHVQCMARWDAQLSTIRAMTVVDGYIVTGCEAGTLMLFHPFHGGVIKTVSTGDQPIRSLLGLNDGRLFVGRKFYSVLMYTDLCSTCIASATLHPKNTADSRGVVAMAMGSLDRAVHIADKPQFFHPELYAVPTCVEDMRVGVFQVLFVATELHVRVLDAATLEEVEHIQPGNMGPLTSLVVHQNRYLVTGSQDGSVRVHDMSARGFPQVAWLQCFGGMDGVSSLCIHPNGTMWRDENSPPTRPPTEPENQSNAPVIVCIGGADGSVGFWDFKEKALCDNVVDRGHKGAVVCMLPVDGSLIATGGADEYWRVWNGKAPSSFADLPGSMYCAVAQDNMLFAAGSQGCVRLWTSGTLRYNGKRQAAQPKQVPL